MLRAPPRSLPGRGASSAAASAAAAVQAAVEIRHLPLGGGEELLELVLKGLVPGGGQRLLRPGSGVGVRGGMGRAGRRMSAGPGASGRMLRPGERPLDGEVDLSVLHRQDQDLDGLPLLEEIVDVVDERVGDLGDVDQAGLPIVQGHERAEFGDGGHLSL